MKIININLSRAKENKYRWRKVSEELPENKTTRVLVCTGADLDHFKDEQWVSMADYDFKYQTFTEYGSLNEYRADDSRNRHRHWMKQNHLKGRNYSDDGSKLTHWKYIDRPKDFTEQKEDCVWFIIIIVLLILQLIISVL